MNDYELDRALDAIHQGRADLVDPPRLHARALTVPTEYPPRRSWLPRMDTGGFVMYSAAKFVVAGIIVALFGGLLLMSVLTTQQGDEVAPAAVTDSPEPAVTSEPTEAPTTMVRTDLLPGVKLTVEEVEPGVFRVASDGVRDLVLGGNTDVVAGHDAGIWLLHKNRFFRLGSEATQQWPDRGGQYRGDFEVTPDGTVWVTMGNAPGDPASFEGDLFSSDGDGWTRTQSPPGAVHTVEVASDGTLWASWRVGDGWDVGHLEPSGWQPLAVEPTEPDLEPSSPGSFYVTDAGDLYGTWFGLHRYEDGRWRVFTGLAPLPTFDVGPDGTIWQLGPLTPMRPDGTEYGRLGEGLARFVGGEWELWRGSDLPEMGAGIAFDGEFDVAPDGSLWASLWQRGAKGDVPERGLWYWQEREGALEDDRVACDGVARFDGESVTGFLPGRCITMDIAADRSVWVLTDEDRGKDLYVITPEAVAAA